MLTQFPRSPFPPDNRGGAGRPLSLWATSKGCAGERPGLGGLAEGGLDLEVWKNKKTGTISLPSAEIHARAPSGRRHFLPLFFFLQTFLASCMSCRGVPG